MADEALALNGLAIYGGEPYTLESLRFIPSPKARQMVGNPDADGEVLVREATYGNCSFEVGIRVEPQVSMNAALEALGELRDALQSCARSEGGVALEWTPAGATTTYKAWALDVDETAMPIELTGDDAGWLLDEPSPVLRFTILCAPFLETPEELVYEATESEAIPYQQIYVPNVKGDVPAKARIVVTEKSSESRRYVRVGRDVVASQENPSLLLVAANLTVSGFAGSSTTRTGAYNSSQVKRATAITLPTTIAGTGAIEHVGSFRVHGRVYATSETVRYRLAYRMGDGPLRSLYWQTPPAFNEWAQIDFGEVTLDEAVSGEQVSELRVEVKTTSGTATADVNYLLLIPTDKGMGTALTRPKTDPTTLVGLDLFEQSEGNLAGKTANNGGTWAEAGDAVRFKVIAAEDVARRSEREDANVNTGAYAILGSSEPTTCRVSVHISVPNLIPAIPTPLRTGVLLRYTDTNNWALATIEAFSLLSPVTIWWLKMYKRVSGTVSEIRFGGGQVSSSLSATLEAFVGADGSWEVSAFGQAIKGKDSAFLPTGALAKGKVGIYDAYPGSIEGLPRNYSNFTAVAAEDPAPVLYSGRKAEIRSDGYHREDSTGNVMGLPSSYRGSHLYLDPDGGQGRINRLALMARRLDVTEAPDANVTDKTSVTVYATPRYLAPR